jgi:uncharacterized protein (DUF305 family)
MKKTFILAGFTTVLLACNNDSDNHATHIDSSGQGAPHQTSSSAKQENDVNPITETMDKMMHDMHGATPTGNNDIDFAVMMVAHHKGAVEMSKVEVQKGADAELKAFAQQVIDDQNKEIAFMQEAISKAPQTTSSNSSQFQKALNGSMAAMMGNNTTLYNDIDKDFAAQMIPHHQSAVDMAEAYLQYGKETSLRTLCQNIIHSQTKEIDWLKAWLAKHTKQ